MKEIKTVVQEIINAPSCYPALREVAQDYLDRLGTDKEKEAAKKLVEYTEECVEKIDDVLQFFQSDAGKKVFGEEKAVALAKQAKEVKAKGGKYCFCPACTAGVELLERKAEIL
ncbi:hypothetical protein HMPREF0379_1719 [[Eubacterium] yurii subsp. margaretiae ATCC 43715]|nr:hypothetical protein HMPREF0379_1719 [[Eubacterium] yurii subsp. margaretiae ATCC 43715]